MRIIFFSILAAFSLHLNAAAQSLSATPSRAEVIQKFSLGDKQQAQRFNLCFRKDDGRDGLGRPTKEKMLAIIDALESVGVDTMLAFNAKRCPGTDSLQPAFIYWNTYDEPFFRGLVKSSVLAVVEYARANNKSDDWVKKILYVTDHRGDSLYSDGRLFLGKSIKEFNEGEKSYRETLASQTPTQLKMYGPTGLDYNWEFINAHFGIVDKNDFHKNCTFGPDQRKIWAERLRLFERGEYSPRGLVEPLVFSKFMDCVKEPNYEDKLVAIEKHSGFRGDILSAKKKVKDSIELIAELTDLQENICPPGVAALKDELFCKQTIDGLVARMKENSDNVKSGYSVKDFRPVG